MNYINSRHTAEKATLPIYNAVTHHHHHQHPYLTDTKRANNEIETPPSYSATTTIPSLQTHSASSSRTKAKDLEERIICLWEKVWKGLYNTADNDDEISHHRRIEALRCGAGLNDCWTKNLPTLQRRYHYYYSSSRCDPPYGIAGLKLYKGLSVRTLLSILQILEAYETHIPVLHRLYALLTESQLNLYHYQLQHTTTNNAEEEEEEEWRNGWDEEERRMDEVRRKYLEIADPLEKALAHFDARMDVLMIAVHDEARALHGDRYLKKGQPVYRKVFPIT